MDILTQHQRNYKPIDLQTRFHACKRVKNHIGRLLKSVLFHAKRSSLFRWLEKFDGSKESLIDKSHKPLSPHQRTLSEEMVQKTLNINCTQELKYSNR